MAKESQAIINVDIRLRPIRFAFLVRPNDKSNLMKIFQINTCLWGGMYNPIIPFFKQIPAWWERGGAKFENAKQVINGYLDFFEPDFVVEAEAGLAEGFGIDPKRIIALGSILPSTGGDDRSTYGLCVFDLYKKLYRTEFQFVQRHNQNVINVSADSKINDTMAACLFGNFPTGKKLNFYAQAYQDAFDPNSIILTAASLKKIYKSKHFSALRMGYEGIEIDYNDRISDPTLFILDAQQSRDLLDFWNLRAFRSNVIAIPLQWLPDLSDYCKQFLLRNYRPLPNNAHGAMIHPTCLFSRSIHEEDIQDIFNKYLHVDKTGANSISIHYPPIWRPRPDHYVRQSRPTLIADSKSLTMKVNSDEPQIEFETLSPDFADKYFGSDFRWANIIKIQDWTHKDTIATVFPTDFKVNAVKSYESMNDFFLSTKEGFVAFPRYKNSRSYWSLINGRDAIESWLKGYEITCQTSGAGRSTQQVIQTLGGFNGVRCISSKGVIEVLNGMARSITRSSQHRKFQSQIRNAISNSFWRERTHEILVERNAVELGQELNCSKCGSWGWYAINQLNTQMQCHLCLKHFEFPITQPTNSQKADWAYRVIGPFALPDYAAGGYASALAIRFFPEILGHARDVNVTWSAGLELTFNKDLKIETDFLLWYQRKHYFGLNDDTQIVFGEAKSFGKDAFKTDDINRMKLLGEKFPGSILVFATMKEAHDLSKDEIAGIRKLAEWGREYIPDRRSSRAPVILLTGTELFCSHYLGDAWKGKSELHNQLLESGSINLENLKSLADSTQQLYLGMPSYFEWRRAKWDKKMQRNLSKTNSFKE